MRPNQYPITKIDNDHWQVTFDKIFSPGHEIGFSPDGRFFCMMNNLREQLLGLRFKRSRSAQLEKDCSHRRSPVARQISEPIPHGVFHGWLKALIFRSFTPRQRRAGSWLSIPKTWTIKKEIQGIGPDMQTLAVTYDGKYVIGVFSGFQRLASGIAFIDAHELVGIWPSNGGHHDGVIIPTELEHKHTRSCAL